MKPKEKYTWEQINKALLIHGTAPKNIASILSILVKIKKSNKMEV